MREFLEGLETDEHDDELKHLGEVREFLEGLETVSRSQ